MQHERDSRFRQSERTTEGQLGSPTSNHSQLSRFIAPFRGDSLDASAACRQIQQQRRCGAMKDIHKRRNHDQKPLVIKDQRDEVREEPSAGTGHLHYMSSGQDMQAQDQPSTLMGPVASIGSMEALEANRSLESTQQTSCQERESARRLAKRLYNLSGFKKSDVCHHLSKSNPFSQMVAEEYLNLFDFRTMKLDAALRKFLSKLQLNGETQERERMLSQFSKRYYDCNKEKFPNADTVQTLVCALILLNTDFHGNHLDKGKKSKRGKLSLGAFIDGLNSSLAATSTSNGAICAEQPVSATTHPSSPTTNIVANKPQQLIAYAFPRHLLVDLYESIKKRPIKYVEDKCDMTSFEAELDRIHSHHQSEDGGCIYSRSNTLPARRFAPGSNAPSSTMSASSGRLLKRGLDKMNGFHIDDPEFAIEFKSGFLHRKRVFEPHGKPTAKGRRGWRQAYFIVQDLRLIMRYDYQPFEKDFIEPDSPKVELEVIKQQQLHKNEAKILAQDLKNTVRIHHTFAKRSTVYKKREYVFHLKLANQSEYLIQASSELEMLGWIDAINFASACFSSPALPSAVTNGRRFQRQPRPILSASYTKLSYWEQLIDHEERLQRLKVELEEHLNEAPNTKTASQRFQAEFIDKIAYLKHEIERYSAYVDLMRKKSNSPEAIVLSKHPQIASLKPSDGMIKSLPSFAPQKLVENMESIDGDENGAKQNNLKIESTDFN